MKAQAPIDDDYIEASVEHWRWCVVRLERADEEDCNCHNIDDGDATYERSVDA